MPADRHKQSSKYTADRGMPGAFEGETVTRRRFMEAVTHGAGGIAAAVVHPARAGLRARADLQARAVRVADHRHARRLHRADYVTKVITIVQGIGEAGKSIAYVRKRDPAIDDSSRTTSSTTTSRCRRGACTSAARSATSRRPSASSARATAASTTSAARSPAARRCARSTASTPMRRRRAPRSRLRLPRPALLGQLRAAALLAARPWRAARRHRPVPVPVALRHLGAAVD